MTNGLWVLAATTAVLVLGAGCAATGASPGPAVATPTVEKTEDQPDALCMLMPRTTFARCPEARWRQGGVGR